MTIWCVERWSDQVNWLPVSDWWLAAAGANHQLEDLRAKNPGERFRVVSYTRDPL